MEGVLQAIVAGALVLASSLYAAWRLTPARGRLRLLSWLAALPGHTGRRFSRMRDAAIESAGHGCHTCPAGRVKPRAFARTRTPAAPRR